MAYSRSSSAQQGTHILCCVIAILAVCYWDLIFKLLILLVGALLIVMIGRDLYKGSIVDDEEKE